MNMGHWEAWIVFSDVSLGWKYDMVWHWNWQAFFKDQFDAYNIRTKWQMPPAIWEHIFKWMIKMFGMWKK
jgi:hypothetical protein